MPPESRGVGAQLADRDGRWPPEDRKPGERVRGEGADTGEVSIRSPRAAAGVPTTGLIVTGHRRGGRDPARPDSCAGSGGDLPATRAQIAIRGDGVLRIARGIEVAGAEADELGQRRGRER